MRIKRKAALDVWTPQAGLTHCPAPRFLSLEAERADLQALCPQCGRTAASHLCRAPLLTHLAPSPDPGCCRRPSLTFYHMPKHIFSEVCVVVREAVHCNKGGERMG